jgi:hypothetical protein
MGDGSSVSIPPTSSSAPVPSPAQVPVRPTAGIATGVKLGVKLDAAAVAEAHQRDNTATRSFTGVAIKVSASQTHSTRTTPDRIIQTSDGQCLFVDPTSGDFRENLTLVQIKPCNGSDGQKWDVITAGKHNDQPGFALIVSSQVANSRLRSSVDHF